MDEWRIIEVVSKMICLVKDEAMIKDRELEIDRHLPPAFLYEGEMDGRFDCGLSIGMFMGEK